MALKDWDKKGEDFYITKEFPHGKIYSDKVKDGYVVMHKPANIGSEEEPIGFFTNKIKAHGKVMNHIKNYNY